MSCLRGAGRGFSQGANNWSWHAIIFGPEASRSEFGLSHYMFQAQQELHFFCKEYLLQILYLQGTFILMKNRRNLGPFNVLE